MMIRRYQALCAAAALGSCDKPDPEPPPPPPPPTTWSATVRINDDATAEQQREVSVAVDARGNWYAGWMDRRRGAGELDDCAFAGSSDGVAWTENELYKGP